MQKTTVIAKPPMPPADKAAADSSIGFGRRGSGGKSHAVHGRMALEMLRPFLDAAETGWDGIFRPYLEQDRIAADKIDNGQAMLYKYCSVNTAEKIFRDGAVLLNSAGGFNDPFEMNCQIRWPDDNELRRQIDQQFALLAESERAHLYANALKYKRESGDNVQEKTSKLLLQHVGASCFSETQESILMWSHYADEHKGVCIGFSALELLRSLWSNRVKDRSGGGIPLKTIPCVVQYRNALPIWNAGRSETTGDVVATKARCWGYEREWRIFALCAAGEKQRFLPETFEQVIFGARIAENDRKRMARMIAKRYPSVQFLQAEISRRKYKVEFSSYQPLHT